jgi:CubicO group peptidase (beta-lactamase class C family)
MHVVHHLGVLNKKHKRITCVISLVALIIFSVTCSKEEEKPVSPREAIFNDIVNQIENHRYGEVHSLIIAEDDSIIFEKYFNGYTRDRKHALYSVTKSFTSALIGICLEKGYINNIDMKVLDFFPEYKSSIANDDSLKEKITIRDLLTMTSGFKWDEWTTSFNDQNNDVVKLSQSSNWVKSVLDLPMSYAPGTTVTYNSGVSHVLSGIITKVTGQPARDFARDNLFSYLEINDWNWENRPDGISIGGWGLSLRPIDMIRFGQLYLKKGLWNNVQVVPANWIEASTIPHNRITANCDYGYQWWRYRFNMGSENTAGIFFASGRGNQFIWVIPDHNAVVVCTAWNDGQTSMESILWDYILRALDKGSK